MGNSKRPTAEVFKDFLGDNTTQENKEQSATTQEPEAKRPKGRPREEEFEARTFRVKKELAQKLKIIARKEGRLQKDILDFALESTIARYEEKHGVIDVSQDYGKRNIKDIF